MMTIEELQTGILDTIAGRDAMVTEARKLFIEAAEAEHAYRMAQAKAYLKAEGKNADERRGQVDQMVDREMFAYKIADAKANGVKEALRATADKINAYQSLLRLERMEAEAIHYGQRNGA